MIERRRAERARLVASAQAFVDGLPAELGMHAAAVFGSVARGDFNQASDIDVLIVVERGSRDYQRRLGGLGDLPADIEPVVWTVDEWRRQRKRGNPIAVEVDRHGVWLVGGPDQQGGEDPPP